MPLLAVLFTAAGVIFRCFVFFSPFCPLPRPCSLTPVEEAGKGKERAYERFWPSSSKAKENGERPQSSWKEEREACVGRREGSVKSGGAGARPEAQAEKRARRSRGLQSPGRRAG